MKSPLRDVRDKVLSRVKQVVEPARALVAQPPARPPQRYQEPPVVARLVVEVRSDGSHTIARGAIEDASTGEQMAISAEGTTPAQLAASLAKSMFTIPLMAVQAARGARREGGPRFERRRADAPEGGSIDTEGGSPSDRDDD